MVTIVTVAQQSISYKNITYNANELYFYYVRAFLTNLMLKFRVGKENPAIGILHGQSASKRLTTSPIIFHICQEFLETTKT
ncbi:hypothetical protein T12_11141 [Trichinella patagoniensis]|uniref:Uncharacterized protein n=1 Tax=Trichinella patagoniensis TaxID=990121 RepID=A0A0V0ZBZ4_9BILA|nr:hypothetical protein T12_11141 [Trichinella patagoniensis]